MPDNFFLRSYSLRTISEFGAVLVTCNRQGYSPFLLSALKNAVLPAVHGFLGSAVPFQHFFLHQYYLGLLNGLNAFGKLAGLDRALGSSEFGTGAWQND